MNFSKRVYQLEQPLPELYYVLSICRRILLLEEFSQVSLVRIFKNYVELVSPAEATIVTDYVRIRSNFVKRGGLVVVISLRIRCRVFFEDESIGFFS
jgi:hypothetical protein